MQVQLLVHRPSHVQADILRILCSFFCPPILWIESSHKCSSSTIQSLYKGHHEPNCQTVWPTHLICGVFLADYLSAERDATRCSCRLLTVRFPSSVGRLSEIYVGLQLMPSVRCLHMKLQQGQAVCFCAGENLKASVMQHIPSVE